MLRLPLTGNVSADMPFSSDCRKHSFGMRIKCVLNQQAASYSAKQTFLQLFSSPDLQKITIEIDSKPKVRHNFSICLGGVVWSDYRDGPPPPHIFEAFLSYYNAQGFQLISIYDAFGLQHQNYSNTLQNVLTCFEILAFYKRPCRQKQVSKLSPCAWNTFKNIKFHAEMLDCLFLTGHDVT